MQLVHLLGSVVFLLATLSSSSLVACQSIDTRQPILREVSGLADGSMFGYTLVLHQTSSNPSNMNQAINGARIVVSAPKGTAPGGVVPNTGLVYSCPVNPGTCSPLPGSLFDTTPNDLSRNENKTGQFLGASMDSDGDSLVVCAHRYVQNFLLLGRCFFTDGNRALTNFQEYLPCTQTRRDRSHCQTGISSVTVPVGDSHVLGLGAPGFNIIDNNNDLRTVGGVIRRSTGGGTVIRNAAEIDLDNRYVNQGYAIASGRFMTTDREDFAVSVPRDERYFGTVHFIMNANNLQRVSQPLTGRQMGEYFGFSILAVDIDRDGFDELLVGAPLYRANVTEADTGRVFLYKNNEGNLVFERTIDGQKRFSRFGHAMANLGDINNDGLDDVAISAPFTETGTSDPGTVFIYHGSPGNRLLTDKPQQIIRGTDLSLTQDLSGLRGFGTSLASGVDVDLNNFNDLLIGSFLSQQAFLLRTRPLARAQVTIAANPMIVDVMNRTSQECILNGIQYACFNLTACATYSGRGLTNTLRLRFNVSGDTLSLERRIFFEDGNSEFSREITANIDGQSCTTIKAYVQNAIFDVFNPFVIEMSVDTPLTEIPTGDGNDAPVDLSGLPTLTVTGASQVQVETLKECGGGECIPDLRISVTDTLINPLVYRSATITTGSTSSVDIFVDIENAAEDAFQASLSFILPTNLLELVNVFNQTRNGEVSLSCRFEPLDVQNQQTRYDCFIGNPFAGPGRIRLRVNLSPNPRVVGDENALPINFTVSSLNPENINTVLDTSNFFVSQLMFEARANITIDDGVVTPERISYADNSQLNEGVSLTNITQLGPPVDVSFLIRNSGPSRIANIQLDISWPLNSSMIGENYYLYITSIQSSGAATVMCNNEYINPLNLEGDLSDQGDQEGPGGDPTVSMGTGRRKKRSTVKRTLRNKRQEAPIEQQLSENRTLNCMSSESDTMLNCVNIRCNVLGLPGSGSVQVDINSRLDERFFSMDNDHYIITPIAEVSIVDGDFIQSNDGSSQRSASARISVIPAARVVRNIPQPSDPLPWWVIVVPIVAAVIIITVVAILLWLLGFFRRRKHEEIKQRREELQNLNDHGVTPTDASVDNIGDTNIQHIQKGGRGL